MATPFISQYQPFAEKWEGVIPWMYLDGNGYLTIGIGHLLPTASLEKAIKELWKFGEGPQNLRETTDGAKAFAQACGGRKFGPQWDSVNKFIHSLDPETGEIRPTDGKVLGVLGMELPEHGQPGWKVMLAEARRILHLPHGQRDEAGFFHCFNSFEMLDAGIGALFEHDVNETLRLLTGKQWHHVRAGKNSAGDYLEPAYPEFANIDNFPPSAKMVLVDLAFQMGAAGVANAGNGAFRKAIGAGDWKKAAELCPQPKDAQKERNDWRRERMKLAIDEAPKPPPSKSVATPPK